MTKGMGRAALIVSVGILVSRLLGFVREAVIAALLGTSSQADVYWAAFTIPDILFYLMAGGYLSITFIPILSRHLADGDEDGQWRSFAAIAKPVTVAMIAITVGSMIFADHLVDFVFVTIPTWLDSTADVALGPNELVEVTYLTRIVLPAQIFFMLGSLLAAIQYAHQRFTIPSLAPLVYNVSIILGGVIGPTFGATGAAGFAWGALMGAIVGNFGLQLFGARRVGLRWVSGTSWRDPVLGEYFKLAVPLMLGQSIAVLDAQFIPIFGQTIGQSAISLLSYGRRLNMFPVGIIAQAAGVAAYPFLARLAESGKITELANSLGRAVRYTIFIGFGAGAAVYAAATPAVRVAYQRINFTPADTTSTALALAIFSLSIPLWGAHQVYSRGFYSRRQMWTPVIIGTLWTAIGTVIYWQLANRYGLAGVAWASVLTMAFYTIHLAATWYRRTDMAGATTILLTSGRSALVAAVAGLVGSAAVGAVIGPPESMSLLEGFLGLATAAVVVGTIYLGGTTLLGSTELRDLRKDRTAPKPS